MSEYEPVVEHTLAKMLHELKNINHNLGLVAKALEKIAKTD